MKENPELLYMQICTITTNIYEYKDKGYSFEYDIKKHRLIISYRNNTYEVKVIEKDNTYFWYLEPYNSSCFMTNYYNPSSFDMVLFAIKEDVELYSSK